MSQPSISLLPLGTGAAEIRWLQRNSAYLLRIDQEQFLLDAGTFRIGSRDYIDPFNLKAIFITHGHIDHRRAIGWLIRKLNKRKRVEPLHIFITEDAIGTIRREIAFWNGSRVPSFVKLNGISEKFQKLSIENLKSQPKISVMPAFHKGPTLTYRFDIPTENSILSIVYTPDTNFNSLAVADFARGTHYWMLDTTFNDIEMEKIIAESEENKIGMSIKRHSSPKWSAKLCQQAQAECYIAIHYHRPRFGKTWEEIVTRIRNAVQREYNGRLIIAQDLVPITLN